MAFRVTAFLIAAIAPMPYNAVLFVAAAVLPGIAVLFGNAVDNRKPTIAEDDEPDLSVPALPSGEIVRGEVDSGEDS